MRRRTRVHSTLTVLLACVACDGGGGALDAASRPAHVLLLTVDTLRSDHVAGSDSGGFAEYPQPTTPFLDELLTEGVRFPNTLAPVPRTTQSLASVMTGAYPHSTGVRTLYDRLTPGLITLAESLRSAGYATVAVVSNHVLVPERGLGRGFDVYDFADDARQAAATTAAALRHVSELEREAELFLWVHYIDPHVPYLPPPELARDFDPGYSGRYELGFGSVQGGTGDLAYPEDLPKREAVYRNPLPDRVNQHVRALYAADVRSTDNQIRVLVEGLRERLGDDWLIVFTADHGESLGEHDFFYDHGDYVHNAALRVPLGVVLPRGHPLRHAGRVDTWVSLVDVAPTLLEILALPARHEGQFEGRSLVPLLASHPSGDGDSVAPRPVFAESGSSFFPEMVRRRVDFSIAGRFRTVVLGDWKLIWTPGLEGEAAFELHDLGEDPGEEVDLSATHPVETERLRQLLFAWLRAGSARSVLPPAPLSEDDAERLRALGYISD